MRERTSVFVLIMSHTVSENGILPPFIYGSRPQKRSVPVDKVGAGKLYILFLGDNVLLCPIRYVFVQRFRRFIFRPVARKNITLKNVFYRRKPIVSTQIGRASCRERV